MPYYLKTTDDNTDIELETARQEYNDASDVWSSMPNNRFFDAIIEARGDLVDVLETRLESATTRIAELEAQLAELQPVEEAQSPTESANDVYNKRPGETYGEWVGRIYCTLLQEYVDTQRANGKSAWEQLLKSPTRQEFNSPFAHRIRFGLGDLS